MSGTGATPGPVEAEASPGPACALRTGTSTVRAPTRREVGAVDDLESVTAG